MTEDIARRVRATAQAIAGDKVLSDWLLNAVERLALELSYTIAADQRVPKRVDLRQKIAGIREASKLISYLLFPYMHGGSSSLLLVDHLLRDGEHRLDYEGDLYRYLTDLSERCEESLSRIPEGSGRKRGLSALVEENTASSDTVCALAVDLLWTKVRGRPPGLNDEQAHEACAELWRAAGSSTTKTSGWKNDLKRARDPMFALQAATLAERIGVQRICPETPD